jgi:hydroxypyruvate reductase
MEIIESGHPVPNEKSLAAGEAALEFVSKLKEDDLLICLISGGGSALMTAPLISLDKMQALTSELLACGARIDEINTLRRHLDRVKGGGIAEATNARVLSLILSDVVGNPLEAIASGPTAPDPTTKDDAIQIIRKYELSLPASILDALSSGLETPKADNPIFARVRNLIVGDNALAAQAALSQALQENFHTQYLGSHWQGEAREVGVKLAQKLRKINQRPFCMVAGGETTVTIKGNGRGGRNQELALAAVPELEGLADVMLITLATDGEDGPTDAAGAVVTGETNWRANVFGLATSNYLSRNDSYTFFDKLDDLIKIGPSGTNVNDLTFLFAL